MLHEFNNIFKLTVIRLKKKNHYLCVNGFTYLFILLNRFAAISGNRCLCGRESGVKGPLVSTVNCATPCGRDATEACGTSDGASTEFYTIWPSKRSKLLYNYSLIKPNKCLVFWSNDSLLKSNQYSSKVVKHPGYILLHQI